MLEPGSTFDLDVISLFPRNTFKTRPNGLRADLAELLADLKPAFMRFPGGCVVEGATMANRWQWKQTIGDIASRPGHWSLWGYRNTDGLGYHEFLQLCEDLRADAMFVCNAGLSCEYRNGDYVAESELEPLIQDTLDAVEYALGGSETKWGAERVRAGHPAQFPLKYIEIGNENHGPIYDRYYSRFAAALRAKWPKLVLIFNGGTTDIGPGKSVQNVDLLGEHYYQSADWFFANFGRYDKVPRDRGYGVYVGEFACNRGVGSGNLMAALSEAAFMMGMEKNGDVVKLASYAPLFFNVNRLDWPVNMIGYDSAVSFGRSSYYAQKLMAENRADVNLKHEFVVDADPAASKPQFAGGFGLGAYDTDAEYRDLVVEQGGREVYRTDFASTAGWQTRSGTWKTENNLLRVTGPAQRRVAVVEGKTIETGTIRVKARKLSGKEGFLVLFGAATAAEGDFCELNLGGWGNAGHDFEIVRAGRGSGIGERRVPGTIETGRWYDIRIEIGPSEVVGYLDGKEVARTKKGGGQRVFAIAGLDRAKNEILIKVVNATANARKCDVQLVGARPASGGRRFILGAASPEEENSVSAPMKLAPREEPFPIASPNFPMELPPWSLSVLRVPIRK